MSSAALTFPALIRLPLPDPHACISEDSATNIRAHLLPRCLPLTAGLFSLVDAQDYHWVMQWRWHSISPRSANTIYAGRGQRKTRPRNIGLHRAIAALKMGRPLVSEEVVDHINGDGLDNRRKNLRLCCTKENIRNQQLRRRQTHKTSRFKGVEWCARPGKWLARIRVNRSLIRIGCYAAEEDAARAYDWFAVHYFGEYARTNFPDLAPPTFEGKPRHAKRLERYGTTIPPRFLGVAYSKELGQWRVNLSACNKWRVFFGHFFSEIGAAEAYDRAVIEYDLDLPLNFGRRGKKGGVA